MPLRLLLLVPIVLLGACSGDAPTAGPAPSAPERRGTEQAEPPLLGEATADEIDREAPPANKPTTEELDRAEAFLLASAVSPEVVGRPSLLLRFRDNDEYAEGQRALGLGALEIRRLTEDVGRVIGLDMAFADDIFVTYTAYRTPEGAEEAHRLGLQRLLDEELMAGRLQILYSGSGEVDDVRIQALQADYPGAGMAGGVLITHVIVRDPSTLTEEERREFGAELDSVIYILAATVDPAVISVQEFSVLISVQQFALADSSVGLEELQRVLREALARFQPR